jgi:hypothetical protein
MQHGGASAPPPWCHDVASVDVASVATDAGEKTDAAENALVSLPLLLPCLPPPEEGGDNGGGGGGRGRDEE